jgi:hypothetical protein
MFSGNRLPVPWLIDAALAGAERWSAHRESARAARPRSA